MNEGHTAHRKQQQQIVFDAIREHTLKLGWAPSQRALAQMTGINLQRVNTLLRDLHDQGLIDLGPNPREIRIVGSVMTIPEVTL